MSAREYYQKSLRSMSHLNIYLMWSFDPLYLINSAYNESIPSEKTHMTKIRACGLPFNSQGLPSCSVWSTMFNVHLIIAHSTLVGDFFKSTLSALLSLSLNIYLLIFAEIPGLMSASDKSWSAVITKGKGIGSVSHSITVNSTWPRPTCCAFSGDETHYNAWCRSLFVLSSTVITQNAHMLNFHSCIRATFHQ